uniref:DUF3456 domain-containing protein n=1 Tax=Panagrellus redivivus TaxID=6233 RepID=A0A7E4V1L4_PANRE
MAPHLLYHCYHQGCTHHLLCVFLPPDVQDWAKSQEYDHQTKIELEELQKEHEFEVEGIAADTMASAGRFFVDFKRSKEK